jgi:hypothetical protein
MRNLEVRVTLLAFMLASTTVGLACSSEDENPASGIGAEHGGATTTTTSSAQPGVDGGSPSSPDAAPPPPPPPPAPLTFSYAPGWEGAKTVEVIGAFGQLNDWTVPIASLTAGADGTFTGTTPALRPGSYTYLFKVTGDGSAPTPAVAKTVRYAMDPKDSAYEPCPAGSPTYHAGVANLCSVVASSTGSPTAHVRGKVVSNGEPIADYLVMIERSEVGGHHTFVNRTVAAKDGSYDLVVALGTYQVSVLHPTFYSLTDAQRTNPADLAAIRRTMSSAIVLTADVDLGPVEVAYGDYAAMTPQGSTTLPTTFAVPTHDGFKARAAVYGPGKTVGDPWWTSDFVNTPTTEFDGGFDTKAAADAGIDAAAQYWWGTLRVYPKAKGGVSWTAQSMVLPIQWEN